MNTITLNQSSTTKSDPSVSGVPVAIYLRVSTSSQTTENQLLDLQKVATQNDWDVVGVYTDEGVSGKYGRDKRPQFDALMKDAYQKKFQVIMSWDVSRLGRSLKHLVEFMEERVLTCFYFKMELIRPPHRVGQCLECCQYFLLLKEK